MIRSYLHYWVDYPVDSYCSKRPFWLLLGEMHPVFSFIFPDQKQIISSHECSVRILFFFLSLFFLSCVKACVCRRHTPPWWWSCRSGGRCCYWPCSRWPRPGCIGCRRRCRSLSRSWWRWCSGAANRNTCSHTAGAFSPRPPEAAHPPSARSPPRFSASFLSPCRQSGEGNTVCWVSTHKKKKKNIP